MTTVSDTVRAPARRLRVLRRPQSTTGFWSWFTTIDHKKIGIMYGTTALAFLVIGGVEGLAERSWEGRSIRLGEVVILARDLRQRCVMTTYDPDTAVQDIGVLRRIVRDFGGTIALNCLVLQSGAIRIGDRVELAA